MFKWIVILMCSFALTACGSMSPTSSSGSSEVNSASGMGMDNYSIPGPGYAGSP